MAPKRKSRGRRTRGSRLVEWAGVDPPVVQASPWNHVVLVFRGVTLAPTAWTQVTVKTVKPILISQLGLHGVTSDFEIRLLRADVWGFPVTGATAPVAANLGVAFYSPIAVTGGLPVSVQEDVGTSTRPAHLHHRWKLAEREVPLSTTSDFLVVAIDAQAEGLPLLYHLSICWRSLASDPVPTSGRHSAISIGGDDCVRRAPPRQFPTAGCPGR